MEEYLGEEDLDFELEAAARFLSRPECTVKDVLDMASRGNPAILKYIKEQMDWSRFSKLERFRLVLEIGW